MASEPPPLPLTANPLKTQLISHLLQERQDDADDSNLRSSSTCVRNPLDESEPFQRLYTPFPPPQQPVADSMGDAWHAAEETPKPSNRSSRSRKSTSMPSTASIIRL